MVFINSPMKPFSLIAFIQINYIQIITELSIKYIYIYIYMDVAIDIN